MEQIDLFYKKIGKVSNVRSIQDFKSMVPSGTNFASQAGASYMIKKGGYTPKKIYHGNNPIKDIKTISYFRVKVNTYMLFISF